MVALGFFTADIFPIENNLLSFPTRARCTQQQPPPGIRGGMSGSCAALWTEPHSHASMLPYILLLACLLLSGQAQSCSVSEIIRHTTYLLSCSCLPIAEPGYEVACFVEGTTHMLENNVSSKQAVTRLKRIFQTQLDRKLCESLTRGNQCQYKTKGNVEEFLNKILRTYQAINKHTTQKTN
ncbi:uncharacterized protein LOC104128899 [Egretta garzetta]|uniref:uncharacterized protein LOC104128899 n=1 Tax=Egretta garzetta TaxID=188379 RepID=UPI00163C158C|nr:uncharacterized protein LOC104128899 [Egretta garzetta]